MLDERGQLAVLAAIGIEVYRLRASTGAQADSSCAEPAAAADRTASGVAPARELVVACPRGQRGDRRLTQILRALGRGDAGVAWVDAETLADMPDGAAYLFVGSAARACSARLPLARQEAAAIAVIADPAELALDGSAKRALWQALKPLARRLRDEAG